MSNNNTKFLRIKKRVKEEFTATRKIAKVVGKKGAIYSFLGKLVIQIMVHNGHKEYKLFRRILKKKHLYMNLFFEKEFDDFNNTYIPSIEDDCEKKEYQNCIWICWWQGLDNAPEIVKKCVESIKLNAGDHKVIIITEANVENYIKFPDFLKEKYFNGKITKTHLSDFLRLDLLAKYGGIWLDSTFLCVANLEKYFQLPFWSIKRPEYRYTSVAQGYFANYSFGCNYQNRFIFSVYRDYLIEYWKRYDYMIDYLFLDYLIVMASKKHESIRSLFSSIPINNRNCDELLKCMGKIYSEKDWVKLKMDTTLFKLTWKTNYPLKKRNKPTFYGMLISDELK